MRIELSHPYPAGVLTGTLDVTPQSVAAGEVFASDVPWAIQPGHTRTYESVMVANDTLVEADETALIDANIADPEILSNPAVVTVLDDDGPGDPASRPRSERGLILLLGAGKQGNEIFFSEPDATELMPLSLGNVTRGDDGVGGAWSPDGRWILLQHITSTQAAGEPIFGLRVTSDGTVTGEPSVVVPGDPVPFYPTFSADGQRLLFAQRVTPSFWKLAVMPFDPKTGIGGAVHVTGDDPPLAGWNAIWGASFNPDRTRIAFSGCISGNFDCGIFVVPIDDAGAATGPPVAAAYQGLAGYPSYLYPAWSPDGRFLAYREVVSGRNEGRRDAARGRRGPSAGCRARGLGGRLFPERVAGLGPGFEVARLQRAGRSDVPSRRRRVRGRDARGRHRRGWEPLGEPRQLAPVGSAYPHPVWSRLPSPPPRPRRPTRPPHSGVTRRSPPAAPAPAARPIPRRPGPPSRPLSCPPTGAA